MNAWPFADPENVVTVTVQQIIDGAQPILLVSHSDDDGTWMFLTGNPMSMSDALLVSLYSVYQLDQSIAELADLPCGWEAWRKAIGDPWQRRLEE
ncbi:MAG: hypothetical protein ACKV2Q_28955 [Planctomycetaceae bacterium]